MSGSCDVLDRQSVEHDRNALIKRCEMIVEAGADIAEEAKEYDLAEWAVGQEECEELRQYILELRAGLHDERIASRLRQPPLTHDERAARTIKMLREQVDRHERRKKAWLEEHGVSV